MDAHQRLTTREAGRQLGLAADTVKRYCQRGKIRGHKIGRDWLISHVELARFSGSRRRKADSAP